MNLNCIRICLTVTVTQLGIRQSLKLGTHYSDEKLERPILKGWWPFNKQSKRPILNHSLLPHFIVVPENKLLFCYIEKVGSDSFNDLFRFVRSRYDPSQLEDAEDPSKWFKNCPAKHGLSKDDLEHILVDPAWHKAVFYREPLERFASAYASKCGGAHKDGPKHCRLQFGKRKVSFKRAIKFIEESGGSEEGFDVHFLRQQDFCGGLSNTLKYYNTVERLDRSTSHEQVAKLLKQVSIDPDKVPHFEDLFPSPKSKKWHTESHNTGSSEDLAHYFPPGETWRSDVLYKHYRPDYQLFGMAKPAWMNAREVRAAGGEKINFTITPQWPLLDQ